MKNETIVAVATPQGEGALGLIRLSGPQSLQIAKQIFLSSKKKDVAKILTHTVHHGYIVSNHGHTSQDEVLLTVMRAPKTYTGEDIIEISSHGNPIITERIIKIVVNEGAKLAEPGEFTKRAFLNGRIDLSQAEAVIDVIKAKTEQATDFAYKQLEGGVSEKMKWIQDIVKESLIGLEAEIDFSEDDINCTKNDELNNTLTALLADIQKLINSYQSSMVWQQGVRLAIIGKVNVGKSSLFNILIDKENRSLVTHIPGTTRNILHQRVNIGGKSILLYDTAGIKQPRGIVERNSIEMTKAELQNLDCCLLLIDGSKRFSEKDIPDIETIKGKPLFIVINKVDLPQKASEVRIERIFDKTKILKISCKTKTGIEELKNQLSKLVTDSFQGSYSDEVIISNIRHKQLLEYVLINVQNAIKGMEKGLSSEFIASDLHISLENLQKITGESVSDDILQEIFSRFCIGK